MSDYIKREDAAYMDKNDNKSFLKTLLKDIVDKVEVVE